MLRYLKTYGIPLRVAGNEHEPDEFERLAIFDELASAIAGTARAEELRSRFVQAMHLTAEFFTVAELVDLQKRLAEIAEPLSASAKSGRPDEDTPIRLGNLNHKLVEASLRVELATRPVSGHPRQIIELQTTRYTTFETCLWLGVLQFVIEERILRRCQACGIYFEMRQRRANRRFCTSACRERFHNDARKASQRLQNEVSLPS